ncbi:MAG: dihydroorotase [bacterium]|jgi:dihydroorotase
MTAILLKGGRILDFARGLDETGDVLIADGVIVSAGGDALPIKSGRGRSSGDVKTFNCAGCIVTPGWVDLHVHLREPGQESKEDIESGTRAAAAGGFTTVCCMPNTNPPIADKSVVSYIQERADEAGSCRVMPVAALTAGREGREPAAFSALAARGVTLFSDDGSDVADSGVMLAALQSLRAYPATACIHAEDRTLSAGGVMHDGAVAARLGHLGIPAVSETVAVARAILLAKHAKVPVHICHLSSKRSVEIVAWAKKQGFPVTCEVTPQHLLLTEEAVAEWGSVAKVNPPLRSERDRRALVAALADGTIDCIATDHAPHTRDEKEQVMELAPFGIVGLETCAGLLWKHLVQTGEISEARFFDALAAAPYRILRADASRASRKKPELAVPGLTARGKKFWDCVKSGWGTLAYGAPADVTVFDPRPNWTVRPDKFESKCKFSPFAGWKAKGRAALTIVAGEVRHLA